MDNFKGDIAVENGQLVVNGNAIRVTSEKNPADLKWSDVGAEIVVESTGFIPYQGKCQRPH